MHYMLTIYIMYVCVYIYLPKGAKAMRHVLNSWYVRASLTTMRPEIREFLLSSDVWGEKKKTKYFFFVEHVRTVHNRKYLNFEDREWWRSLNNFMMCVNVNARHMHGCS